MNNLLEFSEWSLDKDFKLKKDDSDYLQFLKEFDKLRWDLPTSSDLYRNNFLYDHLQDGKPQIIRNMMNSELRTFISKIFELENDDDEILVDLEKLGKISMDNSISQWSCFLIYDIFYLVENKLDFFKLSTLIKWKNVK